MDINYDDYHFLIATHFLTVVTEIPVEISAGYASFTQQKLITKIQRNLSVFLKAASHIYHAFTKCSVYLQHKIMITLVLFQHLYNDNCGYNYCGWDY